MNNRFLSIMLLSSITFSGAYAMQSKSRLQRKKERIAKISQKYNTQRENMRKQLRSQREDRNSGKCCGGISPKEVITFMGGLVSLGITIVKFIIGVLH